MTAPRGDKWEQDIEARLRALEQRRPLANTGMSVPGPGVTQVDGNLNVTGAENVSGSLNVGGILNVTGDTVIGGDLTMPNGSIQSAWLANLVSPQSVWKGTTANFGLTVAWSTLVTQTLTVPADVNAVQVIGFVRLVATNTTASKDYLYSDFDIAGLSCGGFATPVDPGDPGTSFCSFARTMTGLTPGSTFTLTASGSTSFASWSSTDNVCQISASVTWYR